MLVALPFDDEADLIAQANDSVFGLASGIWTRDYRRAWHARAAGSQAGTVWINTYKQFSISTPFGGIKESGLGRREGPRRHRRLLAAEEHLLGHGPRAQPLGRLRRLRRP